MRHIPDSRLRLRERPDRAEPSGSSCRPTTRPRTSRPSSPPCSSACPSRGACSSSTTPRPTAPGGSPTASPADARRRRGPAPPAQGGPRPRLRRRLSRALAARRRRWSSQMDADFSHDPADLPRLLAAARDADLALGSRYVPAGGVDRLGPAPAGDQPRRQRLRADRARRRRPRPDRRLQGLPPRRCSRRSTSAAIASLGYAFQVETTYRAVARRASAWSRCRSPSATAASASRR